MPVIKIDLSKIPTPLTDKLLEILDGKPKSPPRNPLPPQSQGKTSE